jgi:hypoxanthine phosphoribosyltransferase
MGGSLVESADTQSDDETREFTPSHPERKTERKTSVRILISQEDLEARVAAMAAEIDRDYAESDRLVCIGVLKGSVFFMVDLLKRLKVPLAIDFFQTSSYGSSTSPGEVRIRKDLDLSIRGKDVLLIEDIVDTGYTLRTILDLLRFRGARSVRLCALLDKAAAREVDVKIDYRGFEIEKLFVVGYGLDFDEHYRNLPYIAVLDSEDTPDLPSPS